MSLRTCVGCRRKAPRSELVRIARDADGRVALDRSGRAPGRGAYVCSNVGCLQEAVRRKRIGSALRTAVDAGQLERLREEFEAWAK